MRVAQRIFARPTTLSKRVLSIAHSARISRVIGGDIGGTKSLLGLYEVNAQAPAALPKTIVEHSYENSRFASFQDVLTKFCGDLGEHFKNIAAASLAIAGPVTSEGVTLTNLGWTIQSQDLRNTLRTDCFTLLNDLEGLAWGSLILPPQSLLTLNPGKPRPGNRLVVAAGTGLGQSLIQWDGKKFSPTAAEGGHVDFAPRSPIEHQLWEFMAEEVKREGRFDDDLDITYERLVSGYGLTQIFRFLTETHEYNRSPITPAPELSSALLPLTRLNRPLKVGEQLGDLDTAAVIGRAALAGSCPASKAAVYLFFKIYAAAVRNFSIVTSPWNGAYVGGGIVAKLLPLVEKSAFRQTFMRPGRFKPEFFENIPLHVITDPRTGVLGAAHRARLLELDAFEL